LCRLLGRADDLHALVGVVRRSTVFCNLVADSVAAVQLEPRPATAADAGVTSCVKSPDVVSLQRVAHVLNRPHCLISGAISRSQRRGLSEPGHAHLDPNGRASSPFSSMPNRVLLVKGALRSLGVAHLETHLLALELSRQYRLGIVVFSGGACLSRLIVNRSACQLFIKHPFTTFGRQDGHVLLRIYLLSARERVNVPKSRLVGRGDIHRFLMETRGR